MYPHQLDGALWLSRRVHGYLADEPGLGKTRTALHAARLAGAKRIAVVCPAIVRSHWFREAELFGLGLSLRVWSYSTIIKDRALGEFDRYAPDLLILDEAHYLKHTSSTRTRTLLGKRGLVHQVQRVWCLSGTPMPRNPLEMWPVLFALWPNKLLRAGVDTQYAFMQKFCHWKSGTYGPRIYGVKNATELSTMLSTLMLRRTLDDVSLGLPELAWQVTVLAPSEARSTWVAKQARLIEAGIEYATIESLVSQQLPPFTPQLAKMRHELGDLKAPIAGELIFSELSDSEHKIVVFAYHRSVLDALEQDLSLFGVARVDGDTSLVERDARMRAFQMDPKVRVFLGQIQAASVGITLTAASRVVIVEPDWSADTNVQAGKRVHRIGQHAPCLVRMLALADTLDEALVRQHAREVKMVKEVLDVA